MINKKNTPLIVADTAWADSLPEWLKNEISAERMILGLLSQSTKTTLTPEEQIGDAEIVAYLMTASLKMPLDRDFANIYLFVTGRLMKKVKNIDMPQDIKIDKLSNDEERKLKDLKRFIWNSRGGKFKHPVIDMLELIKKECKA
ncbi:MAG: hypothetical protein M0Q12_06300 [Synergistaceae bacterium]|jgi:hypothetical protein|nr:hypothetical protein [Synergistaceae bacterium]